jgi:hypothetical protein
MWVVIAFAYIADSGLNYRRYLSGRISASQFWTQTSLLSLTTLEGLAGGAGGVALGFALGTLILPGVGSLIGSVVGGLAGGYAWDKLMLNNYLTLEHKIEQAKRMKLHPEHPIFFVGDETYKEALRLLDSTENDELLTVENRFIEKQHFISE